MFAYESLNLGDRLDEIEIPVLIISGDDDRIVPQRGSERIADQIAHAELVIIPDTGHLPQEENSELFLDVVTTFLKRVL